MTQFIAIRVDGATFEVVKKISGYEDRTQGTIVRRALRSYLTHDAGPAIRNLGATLVGPEIPPKNTPRRMGGQQAASRGR